MGNTRLDTNMSASRNYRSRNKKGRNNKSRKKNQETKWRLPLSDKSHEPSPAKSGIVPWFQVGSEWWPLLQFSYSAYELDWKLDPFRGTVDEEDPGEAAKRETMEESRMLLDFDLAGPTVRKGELYHLKCSFIGNADDAFKSLFAEYDARWSHRDDGDAEPAASEAAAVQNETDGLVLTSRGDKKKTRNNTGVEVRLARQVEKLPLTPPPGAASVVLHWPENGHSFVVYDGEEEVEGSAFEFTVAQFSNSVVTSVQSEALLVAKHKEKLRR